MQRLQALGGEAKWWTGGGDDHRIRSAPGGWIERGEGALECKAGVVSARVLRSLGHQGYRACTAAAGGRYCEQRGDRYGRDEMTGVG